MAKTDGVFIYIGTYPSEVAARGDYDVVKDLHSAGAVGSYDAAVITKADDGKVHVNKDETATRHGTWGGIAAGALVGLLFPPAVLASAAVGGAVGGVSGHLWKGMSRSDVNGAAIAAIIEQDSSMSVKVLQLVNSACFGATRAISRIDHAVTYLGMDLGR